MNKELSHLITTTQMKFEKEVKEDLLAVMESFTDLMPEANEFEFPFGTKRLTLTLKGTIPIEYKVSRSFLIF